MNSKNRKLLRRVSLALTLLVVLTILPLGTALADPSFVLDGFKTKWSRADKPVNDGNSNPARSWLWGPEGFNPASGTTEPYGDSPGGVRTVEYFDKARMELNNPANGLVTNGLLVRELISGKLATSDAGSTQRRAADDIPVAGDPGGNDGPTYFSFQKIASLNNDNPSADRTGQAVTDTLSKDGTVGNNPALGSNIKYIYFDKDGLKHNIPDVFWTFMNQRGNVYVNGAFQDNQPVLGDNPVAPWLDAMGFPIADAYWGKVTVAGQVKDVLIQPFERRVVTYTPSNPTAFQVEMGNVGRHYYTWRYTASYDLPPAVTPPAEKPKGCADLPPTPFNIPLRCGPAGLRFPFAIDGFGKSEKVTVTPLDPAGNTYAPTTFTAQGDNGRLVAYADTFPSYVSAIWNFKIKGLTTGREETVTIWLDPAVKEPTFYVTPTSGDLYTVFTFVSAGFPVNYKLEYSIVDANGGNLGSLKVSTSPGGANFFRLQIAGSFDPKFWSIGTWQMTVNGPNAQKTIKFTITA